MEKEQGGSKDTNKLFSGARGFEVLDEGSGNTKKYIIVMPTAEEARQGQWEYTKAYNRALVEGVFTSNEMMDILKKRNIIGDVYEKHLSELQTSVQEKLVELQLAESNEEKRVKATEVVNLREELFQWNNRFAVPMNNTAEQLAADARIDYFTSVLTRHENGDKVWESEKDYLSENNQLLSVNARMEVMLWLEGLDSDALENTPEQVALRELEAEELSAAGEDSKEEVSGETKDSDVGSEPVPALVEKGKTEQKKKKTARRKKKTT